MESLESRARSEKDQVVVNVVTTIAEAENVDADELTPLSDVIDPDALEQLFQSADGTVRVAFEYRQWTVEVRDEGVVAVTERSDGE